LRRLKFVIAGLDPAIHLREESCLMMRGHTGAAHDEFWRDAFSMTHRKLILATALWLAATTTVLADAIDGNWCSADGQHMTIHGDDITTPGGKQIKGNYDRHAFDYVVPADEAGSGETVNIVLRSEYLAVSRQGAANAPVKEWRRCTNRTS